MPDMNIDSATTNVHPTPAYKYRVVFLDVDGVLNNPTSGYGGSIAGDQPEYYTEQIMWDQACVDHLRWLVETAGPNTRIVISSYWRTCFSIQDFLKFFELYGWPNAPVISQTPDLSGGSTGWASRFASQCRADEVLHWVDTHPRELESYVILDDMPPTQFYTFHNPTQLTSHQRIGSRLVVTDPLVGLTTTTATQALTELLAPLREFEPTGVTV